MSEIPLNPHGIQMIFPSPQEAGCSFLTVHGRQRDRALHHAPARWEARDFMWISWDLMVIHNGILLDLVGVNGNQWEYYHRNIMEYTI